MSQTFPDFHLNCRIFWFWMTRVQWTTPNHGSAVFFLMDLGVEPKIGVGFYPPKMDGLFHGSKAYFFMDDLGGKGKHPYYWFNTHMDSYGLSVSNQYPRKQRPVWHGNKSYLRMIEYSKKYAPPSLPSRKQWLRCILKSNIKCVLPEATHHTSLL